MPFQICQKCGEIFLCNGCCGAKSFSLPDCLCLECKKEENEQMSDEWKRDWIENDPCQRRSKRDF